VSSARRSTACRAARRGRPHASRIRSSGSRASSTVRPRLPRTCPIPISTGAPTRPTLVQPGAGADRPDARWRVLRADRAAGASTSRATGGRGRGTTDRAVPPGRPATRGAARASRQAARTVPAARPVASHGPTGQVRTTCRSRRPQQAPGGGRPARRAGPTSGWPSSSARSGGRRAARRGPGPTGGGSGAAARDRGAGCPVAAARAVAVGANDRTVPPGAGPGPGVGAVGRSVRAEAAVTRRRNTRAGPNSSPRAAARARRGRAPRWRTERSRW
jgi:hypothetical protein